MKEVLNEKQLVNKLRKSKKEKINKFINKQRKLKENSKYQEEDQ